MGSCKKAAVRSALANRNGTRLAFTAHASLTLHAPRPNCHASSWSRMLTCFNSIKPYLTWHHQSDLPQVPLHILARWHAPWHCGMGSWVGLLLRSYPPTPLAQDCQGPPVHFLALPGPRPLGGKVCGLLWPHPRPKTQSPPKPPL